MMKPIKISIVVPAYNEGNRLGDSLTKIFAYLNTNEEDAEVIVVDDGSQDGTAQVAKASLSESGCVQTKLISLPVNRGKGYAVRTGLLAASAPIVVFSDADLSTPITELPKVVAPIAQERFDVVFGSRAVDRRMIGVHQPWRREMGGRVFNLIVRLMTGLPFKDTQCGFKAFRADACRSIFKAAKIDRFAFDVELLYLAKLAGLRLSEVPVRWDHNDGSKVNVLRDSLRMFIEVQAIRRRRRSYLKEITISNPQTAAEQLSDHWPEPTF